MPTLPPFFRRFVVRRAAHDAALFVSQANAEPVPVSAHWVRRKKRNQLLRRAFVGALCLPVLLIGGASGAYYYRLHQLSESLTIRDLPRTQLPSPTRRVLVISPHCDDETLGAGGFIADCRKAGVPVTVAFLTNGDGFRVAASRTLHEVSVGPDDFIRFAQKRQDESINADRELGVGEKNVVFMGYPDRGLQPMWETNWDENRPFRSAYTGHTRCPYTRAYKPKAVYCGASLLHDLAGLMETVRPTDILVTHPADDHPDHSAASAFADAALTTCKLRGAAWAQNARLRYFIVHRGDWPLPQGSHPNKPLTPPPGLIARDTRWSAYKLSKAGGAAKARALAQYESQMGVSGRFLVSFERTNELFAELPTPQVTFAPQVVAVARAERTPESRREKPAPSALSELWRDATRMPQSGDGDNFARYADPATDVTGVSLRRIGADKIAVRVNTRGPVSKRVRYRVVLRALPSPTTAASFSMPEASAENGDASRLVSLPVPVQTAQSGSDKKGASPKPVQAAQFVEQTVALSDLGIRPETGGTVWAQAETRWLNRLPVVDRTGYRAFVISGEPDAERGETATR